MSSNEILAADREPISSRRFPLAETAPAATLLDAKPVQSTAPPPTAMRARQAPVAHGDVTSRCRGAEGMIGRGRTSRRALAGAPRHRNTELRPATSSSSIDWTAARDALGERVHDRADPRRRPGRAGHLDRRSEAERPAGGERQERRRREPERGVRLGGAARRAARRASRCARCRRRPPRSRRWRTGTIGARARSATFTKPPRPKRTSVYRSRQGFRAPALPSGKTPTRSPADRIRSAASGLARTAPEPDRVRPRTPARRTRGRRGGDGARGGPGDRAGARGAGRTRPRGGPLRGSRRSPPARWRAPATIPVTCVRHQVE